MIRSFALALAVALVAIASAAQAACKLARIAEWPVRVEGNRAMLDGEINGKKIGILVDTGASRSMIARSAANRMGLELTEARGIRLFGVGGETHAEATVIEELKIGADSQKNLSVLVAGEHDFRGDLAMILGYDFFGQVDAEFDLANKAIRLYQAVDCESARLGYWKADYIGEVPIERGIDRIVLEVALNGKPLRAMLDSGASTSVVTRSFAAYAGVSTASEEAVPAGCFSGLGRDFVEAWIARFDTFTVGEERIHDPRIPVGDFNKGLARKVVNTSRIGSELPPMLLGFDFLRSHRVFIANSQHKLYFSYAGGTVFPFTGNARKCPPPS